VCIAVEISTPFEFITRISSFPKLIRILGYAYRFLNLAKSRERSVSLTARELQKSFFKLMEIIQKNVFVEEYKKIKKGHVLQPSLQMMTLFIQKFSKAGRKFSLIRVGGRLLHAPISEKNFRYYSLVKTELLICISEICI